MKTFTQFHSPTPLCCYCHMTHVYTLCSHQHIHVHVYYYCFIECHLNHIGESKFNKAKYVFICLSSVPEHISGIYLLVPFSLGNLKYCQCPLISAGVIVFCITCGAGLLVTDSDFADDILISLLQLSTLAACRICG